MKKLNEKKELMYETLKRDKEVEIWANDTYSIGLTVWDNGNIHFYVDSFNGCGNGIMYNEDDEYIVWDWKPFPEYVSQKINSKWIKELYWRYKAEFNPWSIDMVKAY